MTCASADAPTLLVVDDDADICGSLKDVLELYGAQVRTASSGPEALEILNDWVPKYAVFDIQMGAMDGFELVAQVKLRASTSEIEVAASTAWSPNDLASRIRDSGFAVLLPKPIDLQALFSFIGLPTKAQTSGSARASSTH